MKKKSILSIILSTALLFTTIFASLPAIVADEDPMAYLQSLVEQWEGVPIGDYTAESYAALQAALANARDVIAAGVPDSSTVVPLVGGYDDPKWEVSNPSGGYVGQFQQESVFGGVNHIDFLSYDESSMRATYKQEALGAYGGVFGNINFRYNHSEDLPVIDFKHDKLNVKIRSGILPDLTTPINFKISMQFKDVYMPWGQADINIPWMATNGYVIPETEELNSPTDGVTFEATIDLAWVLEQEWEQDYLDGLFAGLDYKPELEYIWFRQGVQYAGDAGISFIIDELTLTKNITPVADATAELEAAIDGLEIDFSKILPDLVEQWEDVPIGDYTAESYAALQAALDKANDVIEAGVPDGAITGTVPLVGGLADNPKWEVLKPDGNYVVWSDQKSAFAGDDYIEFSSYGEDGVKAVHLPEATGKYDHPTGYGRLNFRYNHSEDLPVIDFKRDKLRVKIKSSIEPELEHAVNFKICMQFKDVYSAGGPQADVNVPWMIDGIVVGGEEFHTLTDGITFEATIDLAWVLEQEFEADYLDGLFADLNYKPELEYIWFRQDIQQATDAVTGVCFIIEELSLVDHVLTPVADATAELQAAIDGLEIDYPRLLQELVEQWEDEPIGVYTTESYAALQAALTKANAAIAADVPDSIQTVSIVGGPYDPNWEVKNPDSMDLGYTPKGQQIAMFGADYMIFVPYGARLVRCTYVGGQDEYGVPGQFGAIDFRYNRSANPLELNFKSDSISMNFRSGFAPDYPSDAVKPFTIVLSFEEDIPDISIPWIISGDSYATPGSDSYYINEINLADLLTKEYAQEYVNTYLAPLDYKVHVEYLRIDQDVDSNGNAGLSFVINDFTLTDVNTDFVDSYNELQTAIDGLDIVKETTLNDGAKIRTSEPQGLMFGTMVDSDAGDLYIASGYTPTVYGTVLLPENLIPVGEELTKETAKAVYKEFDANEYPNLAEYKVYLIGWTTELQMTRNITARSYVVYEKEGADPITVYSSNTVTRSVYTVAINIYNSVENPDPPLEDNLENGRIAYNWLIGGGE